jgi:hypothetical protein
MNFSGKDSRFAGIRVGFDSVDPEAGGRAIAHRARATRANELESSP